MENKTEQERYHEEISPLTEIKTEEDKSDLERIRERIESLKNPDEALDHGLIAQIIGIDDPVYRGEYKGLLMIKAREMKVVSSVRDMIQAMESQIRGKSQTALPSVQKEYSDGRHPPLRIPDKYEVNDQGVHLICGPNNEMKTICHTLIFPVGRRRNLQTGLEKVDLMYRRDGKDKEVTVWQSQIADHREVLKLASIGVGISSKNAADLSEFLIAAEILNEDRIGLVESTGKLGWHNGGCVPYTSDLEYDNSEAFPDLLDTLKEKGAWNEWKELVLDLRASGRKEIKIMMSAAFASLLVGKMKSLPFFVDLYGETGGGKTVTLKLAASIVADPDEGRYIQNFKNTVTYLEVKADALNHFPLILDDSSNVDARMSRDMEQLIYMLTNGKGKGRSNKQLGNAPEKSWRLCILSSGEHPLTEKFRQGGAYNRILEVHSLDDIFIDPAHVLQVIEKNHGFAGKMFVDAVSGLSSEVLSAMYEEEKDKILVTTKTSKQITAAAMVLLADRLVDEYIFQDGQRITVSEILSTMPDQSEISEGTRAYHFLLDQFRVHHSYFEKGDDDHMRTIPVWGKIQDNGNTVNFLKSVLEDLLQKEGLSVTTFLTWAKKEGVLIVGKDRKYDRKVRDMNEQSVWMYSIKVLDDPKSMLTDGFVKMDDGDEENPFL